LQLFCIEVHKQHSSPTNFGYVTPVYGYFRAWRAAGVYNGGIAERVRNLRRRNRIELEIVKRPESVKGFLVLERRWVVERTFVWLS
jgi:hypothetical protein